MKKQIVVAGVGESLGEMPVSDGAGGFTWSPVAGTPGAVVQRKTATPHSLQLPTFRVDDYAGADPTGATTSNAAFAAAYADAKASIVGSGTASVGAIVEWGPGIYTVDLGIVVIDDYRVGMRGLGSQVTRIQSSAGAASGDIVYLTDSTVSQTQSAPCGGFTIWGGNSPGSNVNGLHFGDRAGSWLTDIEVWGCVGVGSVGVLFRNDHNQPSEGMFIRLRVQQGGAAGVVFDGHGAVGGSASFDYSDIGLHIVSGATAPLQNQSIVALQNKVQLSGVQLAVTGNAQAASTFTTTLLSIGQNASDIASIAQSRVFIAVESDGGGGTLRDLYIIGDSSYTGGIANCFGTFRALGTWTAGSTTGNVLCGIAGQLGAPFFTSTGVLANIGQFSAFDLYANNMRGIIDSTGAVRPGTTTGPGSREWSGSGAPTTPGGALTYNANDRYWRSDGTPSTGRLYVVTSGGGAPTWTAVDGSRGSFSQSLSQSTTSASFVTLTTPDQVTGLVLPTMGLIAVWYQATWQESADGTAQAALFLGANQVVAAAGTGAPGTGSGWTNAVINGGHPGHDVPLSTYAYGLISVVDQATAYSGDVTTGQVVGAGTAGGGPCYIFAAAGTYTVSVRYMNGTGATTTASNRKLWVQVLPFA